MRIPSLFPLLQRIADFVAVALGFLFGYWFYTELARKSVPYQWQEYLGFSAIAAFIFLIVFHSVKLYEREMSLLNLAETRALVRSWLIGSLVLFGISFYIRFLDLSRLMVTTSLICAFILTLIVRGVFYRIHLHYHLRGGARRKVAIYGAGIVGRHLLKRIYHSPALGVISIGFLDDDQGLWGQKIQIREMRKDNGNQVLGGLEHLQELKEKQGIAEIFLALPRATYERNLAIVRRCRELGLAVSIVPPAYDHPVHRLDVSELGGIPILREKQFKPAFYYPLLKRVFDVLVSAFILFILSPVFLIVMLFVRMDSPGPIFFRQKRVGAGGKEFDFYKFRTMCADTDPYALTPNTSGDPRITKFGRWLRRSSLDELPQFYNVLTGDMSIVGPRPEMLFIVQSYNDLQKERLKVKPGLTGIWQISAVRGEPIHANIEYDLFYIENQSLLLDFIIMLKTFYGAIRGIGAI